MGDYQFGTERNIFTHLFDDLKARDIDLNASKRGLWRGKLLVLVGENTFSAGSWLAVLVQDNKLGVVIGQPTGGSGTAFGDVLDFHLPMTGIEGTVSHKYFIRPDDKKSPGPIIPDQVLTPKDYERFEWSPDTEILYALDIQDK